MPKINEIQDLTNQFKSMSSEVYDIHIETMKHILNVDPDAGFEMFNSLYINRQLDLSEETTLRIFALARKDHVAFYVILRAMNLSLYDVADIDRLHEEGSIDLANVCKQLKLFLPRFRPLKVRRLSQYWKRHDDTTHPALQS